VIVIVLATTPSTETVRTPLPTVPFAYTATIVSAAADDETEAPVASVPVERSPAPVIVADTVLNPDVKLFPAASFCVTVTFASSLAVLRVAANESAPAAEYVVLLASVPAVEPVFA